MIVKDDKMNEKERIEFYEKALYHFKLGQETTVNTNCISHYIEEVYDRGCEWKYGHEFVKLYLPELVELNYETAGFDNDKLIEMLEICIKNLQLIIAKR